jgi:cellulose synthase/poly-beta-1,6-N-acetylglucosamine synthase-like glycosyltransferase
VAASLLLYTLFVYAIVLNCIGIVCRKPCETTSQTTTTLIVPAHNEEIVLQAKLENAVSLNATPGGLDIIVASDGSSDRTVEIARAFEDQGVRVLEYKERRGKASVVNNAVEQATGDVVCLCDANVMFEPDALDKLVARLGDPNVGAVTGDVRIASHESNFGQGESSYYSLERPLQIAESRVGSLMGVDGGMYVLRKKLFQPLPADTILDDFVISMQVIKQGHRVVYEPSAVAYENGTPTARQEWRRRVRVAAGAMQSMLRREWPPITRPVELWQYISHKALRWMMPWLLLTLLVSNVLLAPTHWFYQWTLAGQGVVYLSAIAGLVSLRFRLTRVGGITFYFVMSNVAMAVGLLKGIVNRQPVMWQQADRTAMQQPSPTRAS